MGNCAENALMALCNALSSAQLAAAHPVSGGTYECGYRYLRPWLGFAAGWMFLCAKSASAATVALGFAGYLLALGGADTAWRVPLALAALVLAGLPSLVASRGGHLLDLPGIGHAVGVHEFLSGAALMFVAFTGFG